MPSPSVTVDIRESIASFRWNEAEFNRIIAGPEGAVARDLVRRAIRVEAAAKENASGPPGPNVQTGRLRGSITWRLGVDGLFGGHVYVDVGTNVEYAVFVERGTRYMEARPFLRPALEAARVS